MDLFEKYKKMNIDGRLISLEYRKINDPYFCYPVNAEVIGFEGCILYCFIPEYGEMVFASNPESCVEAHVYPLARNFKDFLSLIIACGTANSIEQIVWMNKEQFEKHLEEEKKIYTDEQMKLIAKMQDVFNLTPIEKPFEYVKKIQKDFDGSQIQYSEEYYDILGIESPFESKKSKHEHSFEFNTVIFTVDKNNGEL